MLRKNKSFFFGGKTLWENSESRMDITVKKNVAVIVRKIKERTLFYTLNYLQGCGTAVTVD